MEKRVVLAMVLSIAVLYLYAWLFPPPVQQKPVGPALQGTAATLQQGTVADGPGQPVPPADPQNPAPGGDPADPAPPPAQPEVEIELGPDVTVSGKALDLTFESRGGSIPHLDIWSCLYHDRGDTTVRGDPGQPSVAPKDAPGLLAVDLLAGAESAGLDLVPWSLSEADGTLTASLVHHGVRIEKIVTPSLDASMPYHADVEIRLTGLSAPPAARGRTLEVVGPWLPIVDHPRGEEALLVAPGDDDSDDYTASDAAERLQEDPEFEFAAQPGWRYIGSRADFYLSALLPAKGTTLPEGSSVSFRSATHANHADAPSPPEARLTAAPTFRIPVTLPGVGESTSVKLRLYGGPSSRTVLLDGPYSDLADAFPERMFSITPISSVLSWILSLLANLGLGYGWAVVILTVCVRGALFPLSRKSQISMRVHAKKMSKLKPRMDAIREKVKDPKKQQAKIMELMRSEKVTLLPGGCLLAFAQMPIWISLYDVLQTTFEMRHAGFLWFDDLTAPDHLLEMPWFEGVPLLPDWLNLLPILMMVTWGISARMQPLPEDPAQQQQAKMMRWMPMMFGLMLYNFASGLALYMTMSALWSIGEVQLIRRVWLAKIDAA